MPEPLYVTPCISICKIDPVSNICTGCKRTTTEIREWPSYTHEQRMEIMRRLGYGKRMGRSELLRRYERG